MAELPSLNLGNASEGDPGEMLRHLQLAIVSYGHKNTRQAASHLADAETAARQANLHRQAAKIRKALVLLAQGQTPRLLTRPGYLDHER